MFKKVAYIFVAAIVPLYLRNDVGGPMTRTVEDAATFFELHTF